MRHPLNRTQVELVSRIFTDLAQILFASSVVGFFIPGYAGTVNVPTFIIGAACAAGLYIFSVVLLKS